MKKFLIAIGLCLYVGSAWADYQGCDNLTAEEMAQAQQIFAAAQEIVLLNGNGDAEVVQPKDIRDNVNVYEGREERRFIVGDDDFGAADFYVRFADGTKYLNLSNFIGCEVMFAFIPKELNADKMVYAEHSVQTAEENFAKCKEVSQLSLENKKDLALVRQEIYRQQECYRQALFEFFDAVHPDSSGRYKKAFDDYMVAYKIMRTNVYQPKDGELSGNVVEDYMAVDMRDRAKQVARDYFDKYKNK